MPLEFHSSLFAIAVGFPVAGPLLSSLCKSPTANCPRPFRRRRRKWQIWHRLTSLHHPLVEETHYALGDEHAKRGENGKDCSALKWWDMQLGPGGEVKPSKWNTNKYYKIAIADFHRPRSFLPGTVYKITAHPLVGRINRLVIHCCSFLLHQAISSASSQGPSAALCKVFHFALVSYFIHVISNEWNGMVDFLRRREQQCVLWLQKHRPLVFAACCND